MVKLLKFTPPKKIYEKFEMLEKKLCSSLGGYHSNKVYYIGAKYIFQHWGFTVLADFK